MKVIQSFWSGNQKDFKDTFGWSSYKYHWISWILSCNQLIKFYDKVELYTDDYGYDILINKLKLPYTKVHVVLNELDVYPKDLWAIAKIKAYSLQDEPFIHVDGDVFIWDKFPLDFIKSDLIAQNLESTTNYYRQMWNNFSSHLQFMPVELLSFHGGNNNLACNMGIVGGSDILFFKEYCEKAFEFVNKNIDVWNKINLFNFNIFFEQVLFYELATTKSRKVSYLFNEMWEDNSYKGFGSFHEVPSKRTYLHLLGIFKRQTDVCNSMEVYTIKHYPEAYSKLGTLINRKLNNNDEIDFVTTNKIKELVCEFDLELKVNQFNLNHFLLKRDLYNEGLHNHFEYFLNSKVDFSIILLEKSFSRRTIIRDEEPIDVLEINEINCTSKRYDLDKMDEILLYELRNPIKYFSFISKIEDYLDDDDNDDVKSNLLLLLNSRLQIYLILKIISIYKTN